MAMLFLAVMTPHDVDDHAMSCALFEQYMSALVDIIGADVEMKVYVEAELSVS